MQIGRSLAVTIIGLTKTKLSVTLKYVENAHTDIFTFSFSDGKMEMSFNNSISIMRNKADDRGTLSASQVA